MGIYKSVVTMKLKLSRNKYLALIIALCIASTSIFLIIPLSIQLLGISITVYTSNTQPIHSIQKNTGSISWSDSFDDSIEFNVSPQFILNASVVVDITAYFESYVEGTGMRTTTIDYTFYCNGQKAKTASLDINAVGVKGGASIPGIIIPAKYVKSGNNVLEVHADINSVSEGSGNFSFLYRVEDIELNVHYMDSDNDGVLDVVDFAEGIKNLYVTLGLSSLSVIIPSAIIRKKK